MAAQPKVTLYDPEKGHPVEFTEPKAIRAYCIILEDYRRALAGDRGNVSKTAKDLAVRGAERMRDDYRVNIMRVLDRNGWSVPGHEYSFSVDFSSRPESFFRKFDPVTALERAEGGPADIRPGDCLRIGKDGALVVASNMTDAVIFSPYKGYEGFPLASVRNMMLDGPSELGLDEPIQFIRDGEVHIEQPMTEWR
jgi:hypothetical protein